MSLVALAELKIPFKDKLVTEKIQQLQSAFTLLSVQVQKLQVQQAQGEILGSSEWIPKLRASESSSVVAGLDRPTEAEPPVIGVVRKVSDPEIGGPKRRDVQGSHFAFPAIEQVGPQGNRVRVYQPLSFKQLKEFKSACAQQYGQQPHLFRL